MTITIKHREPKFAIGTKFIPTHRKTRVVYEVVDIILSVSLATGEASHVLTYKTKTSTMGQDVIWECPEATIARSELVA